MRRIAVGFCLILLCLLGSALTFAAPAAVASPVERQPHTLSELYLNRVLPRQSRLGLAKRMRRPLPTRRVTVATAVPTKTIAKTVPMLAYHHLAPADLGLHLQLREVTTPDQFDKDLAYLRDQGYSTIFFGDLLSALQGKETLPAKPIIIFFDDGYQSNYVYAWPVLKKYNMKATINVVSSKMTEGQAGAFNPAILSYLSWDQIKEMVNSGFIDIQSHTHNLHDSSGTQPPIMTANEQVLRQDFSTSKRVIEQHTGKPVLVLSYPNTAYTELSDRVGRDYFQIALGSLGADALGKPLGIGTRRLNVSYYYNAAFRLTH